MLPSVPMETITWYVIPPPILCYLAKGQNGFVGVFLKFLQDTKYNGMSICLKPLFFIKTYAPDHFVVCYLINSFE